MLFAVWILFLLTCLGSLGIHPFVRINLQSHVNREHASGTETRLQLIDSTPSWNRSCLQLGRSSQVTVLPTLVLTMVVVSQA